MRSRKIFRELLDVFDARAAPAVDRLIVIANRRDGYAIAGQHAQPGVLHRVGVLKFVDENVAKAVLVMLQNRGLLEPQFVRAQ